MNYNFVNVRVDTVLVLKNIFRVYNFSNLVVIKYITLISNINIYVIVK